MNTTEHDEQVALLKWCLLNQAKHPELARLFAIPNGGLRNKITAARLKAEGVQRGIPDLCLPVARGGFHGLYIEMKTATGRATPEQRDWLTWLAGEGYCVAICHGWRSAVAQLTAYLQLPEDTCQ